MEFVISLIITLIVLVTFAGCGYKLFNPNCDPASIDVYNDFIEYYGDCKNGDCEKFDFSNLDKKDIIYIP